MRSPELSELPPPPAGKTGWPWTQASDPLPHTLPDGSAWPRISVVTPSYAQGQFIEETIRSVLLQGYPNLEYIIIDGGSKDDTVEIIKKYEPFLSFWVSEKDKGQADAINKGFAKATGEIFYWINSDDFPARNVFALAVEQFNKDKNLSVVYGNSPYIDAEGQPEGVYDVKEFSLETLVNVDFIPQPTAFFTGKVWNQYGKLNENLRCAMDYDLWLRWAIKGFEFKFVPEIVAYYRLHKNSKTVSLVKISRDESYRLVYNLQQSDQLNRELKQSIAKQLYYHAKYCYWKLDFEQFWFYFFQNIKFTRKIPDFPSLRRAFLALFGVRVNQFLFKLTKSLGR